MISRLGSRDFWIPGWRQAAIFLLLVLLGLGAWAFSVAAAPLWSPLTSVFLILLDHAFDSGVVLYVLLALAAGFVFPRGFYLWGVAIVLSHPVATLTQVAHWESQGLDIVRGGALGWFDYAFVLVAMTFVTAIAATAISAAGAGLRLLLDRRRSERPSISQDVRAQ